MSANGSVTATIGCVCKTYKVVPVCVLTLSVAGTLDVALALVGADAPTPEVFKAGLCVTCADPTPTGPFIILYICI